MNWFIWGVFATSPSLNKSSFFLFPPPQIYVIYEDIKALLIRIDLVDRDRWAHTWLLFLVCRMTDNWGLLRRMKWILHKCKIKMYHLHIILPMIPSKIKGKRRHLCSHESILNSSPSTMTLCKMHCAIHSGLSSSRTGKLRSFSFVCL